jgi:Rap1a immunity proteins
MTRFAIVLLALLIASPARADNEMTAGDLYSLCTSADENDLTSCRFYVFGVVQGVILASTMTANRKFVEKNNTVICLPDAVSQNQMVAIVRDTLKMTFAVYPRDRDLAAARVVTAVFLQKFPCK